MGAPTCQSFLLKPTILHLSAIHLVNICSAFPIPPVPQFQAQQAPQPYQAQAGPPQAQYQHQVQYPAQQQVQQNHQYGGPPAQQPYNLVPTPQPYSAPSTPAQYGRPGSQPPPYNQFSPQAPQQQYGPPVYQNAPQNFPTPAVPVFQTPQPIYTPQNTAYAGNYGMTPNHQQWNNAPQIPRNAPPYQRPQRSMSQVSQNGPNGFSVAPSQQPYSQAPRPNNQQNGPQQSMAPQQIPNAPQVHTPAANIQGPNQPARASSTPFYTEAVVPGNVSTRQQSDVLASSIEKPMKLEEKTSNVNLEQPVALIKESPEPEDEEQRFDWDFKYIFKESSCGKVVPLAQPLAATLTLETSPIPQVDQDSTASVSRYARVENLDEYMKGIRDTAQWEFAQGDPVFADLRHDCPLIPIHEVPAWIAKRQGYIHHVEVETSRKRAWSNDQDDVNNQIAQEASEELTEVTRSTKRQRNEDAVITDENMTEAVLEQDAHAPGTPCLAVQMLGGSCVEGLEKVDDAWAPEPGEAASISSPADPTEALLASLGVTGEAKPAKSESLPAYTPEEQQDNLQEQALKSQVSRFDVPAAPPPPSMSPNKQNLNKLQGVPTVNQQNTVPQVASENFPPHGTVSNVHYSGNQPSNVAHHNQQYGPQRSASWSNGPPNEFNIGGPPQTQNIPTNYGPPTYPIYQGGPQVPGPHANSQYGPQRSASYPNPQYGSPQYNGPQPNAQFGHGGGPPQNGQFYGQQQFGNGQSQAQFGAAQYGNQQYVNAPQQGPPQWINGQQQYNNVPYGPPQYPHGPPNQQQFGNSPQGPQQHSNGPAMQLPYNNPHGQPQYGNSPPNQQVNGHFQQEQPQYAGMPPNQQQFNGYQQGTHQQNGFQQQNGSPPQNGYQEQPGPQQRGSYQQNGFQQQIGHQHNGSNQQNSVQQNGPNQQLGHQQQNGPSQNQPPMHRVPPRQDSGYMSARGSYSNESGQNGFRPNAQSGQQGQVIQNEIRQQESQSGMQNGQMKQVEVDVERREDSESEPDTPLSPTSAEILGKLVPGIKGKPSESERRRVKRPQPVVAAAYR